MRRDDNKNTDAVKLSFETTFEELEANSAQQQYPSIWYN